jgi:putative NADPH-quinone reductase
VVARHCQEIVSADGIIMVHPNWWGMPPAIVAGWIDRVLRPEVAYRFLEGDAGEGVPQGLLRARTALVVNTSNTVAAREEQVFGDPLERIWRDCVLGLCGVKTMVRRTYRVVATSTALERERWIADVGGLVRELFPCGR